jgi:hypothetical protein
MTMRNVFLHDGASAMKNLAAFFVLFALGVITLRAEGARRLLSDIPGTRESLSRIVSPKFYRSLQISPIKGWIVVRGQLAAGRVSGARVVHSELGGAYDRLALDLANNLNVIGFIRSETLQATPPILLHLLIYEIADGRLAVSFAHLDGVGGTQMRYYGAAWMAVEKPNHLWVTIDPPSLAPNEKRGPRTYTLAMENPQAKTTLPRAVGVPVMRDR